jgi:hypothetical protein
VSFWAVTVQRYLGAWIDNELDAVGEQWSDAWGSVPDTFSPYREYYVGGWRQGRSSLQIAYALRQADLWAVRAALWLARPDVQELQAVITPILREPYGAEVDILTDAVIIAFSPLPAQRAAAEGRAAWSVAGLLL